MKRNKDKYLNEVKKAQKQYLSLPFLLAKKVKKKSKNGAIENVERSL